MIVFFVLSGFLVAGKLAERTLNGSFDLGSYVIDRLSRIYVPLIPALGFSAVVVWIDGGSVSFKEFLGNLLGLQEMFCDNFADNEPLWSLAYEFWFYILGGAIATLLTAKRGGRLPAMLIMLLGFCVFARLDAWLLFVWCLGAVGYAIAGRTNGRLWLAAGLFLAVGGFIGSQITSRHLIPHSDGAEHSLLRMVAFYRLALGAGIAMLLSSVAVRAPQGVVALKLEGWGSELAKFSYTLYLTHFPLLNLFKYALSKKSATLSAASFLWFAAELAACLLAAWLLYLPFEAQTGRVRRWMRNRFSGPAKSSSLAT